MEHMQRRRGVGYWLSRLLLLILLFITFFPILMMLDMSFKSNTMIKLDFLGLPTKLDFTNYANAIGFVLRPVLNSLMICAISLFFILLFVALSGYTFARMEFKGKKVLYFMLMAVLMIPYTLTIVPTFWVVYHFGWLNTYLAMIVPYISGQQIFGIILARTFYESLPEDMFEAARIDGAGELRTFLNIAVPLSGPILITVGITVVIAMYNDYIWPTIVLTGSDNLKTFCQIVFNNAAGNGSTDYGMLTAAFVLGTIPLLIATCSCLKYYIQGMLEGAVKG